jgi:hypothetical protein
LRYQKGSTRDRTSYGIVCVDGGRDRLDAGSSCLLNCTLKISNSVLS